MIEITETQKKIQDCLKSLENLLIQKNKHYGNSALDPLNIFSELNASYGLRVRIDDKISRIKNSTTLRKNDVCDLIGYLVLLSIQYEWTFEDLID